MKLASLTTLVTGGSQGFGRHIVESFLAEGAHVVFCARSADDVIATETELRPRLRAGQQLTGVPCDVSNPDAVEHLFARVATIGPLTAVVSNAGIYGPIGPTEEVSLTEWDRAWQINVNGTLLVCQAAVRAMKTNGRGKIITISGGGATTPMPRFAAYAATKAAVVRLTETLAEEYRSLRIDVNAVAPGALRTRLTQQVLTAGPEKAGADFFAKNKKWAAEGAVDPALGASLCVYLASSESDGITGKLISAQWDPWQQLHNFREQLKGDIYTLRRIVPKDRGQDWDHPRA
jgi:NAD(P)-dependent dehydrogenase (short-subunit alcohol dehydrogenase family)